MTRDGRDAGEFSLRAETGQVELPWREKYFLYVYLPEGTEISALGLTPLGAHSETRPADPSVQ
jgi:hypothetical protein